MKLRERIEFCKCEESNIGEWWQWIGVCYKDRETGEEEVFPGWCRKCNKPIPNPKRRG